MTTWSPRPPDVGAILERVYALDEPDHEQWLAGVTEPILKCLPGSLGFIGGLMRFDDGKVVYEAALPRRFADVPGTLDPAAGDDTQWLLQALAPASFAAKSVEVMDWPAMKALEEQGVMEPIADIFGLTGVSPDGVGIAAGFMLKERGAMTPSLQRSWARVALHLAAAARLRVRGLPEPELVATPEGKVLHAEGPAEGRAMRDALRAAVRAVDRVRGRGVRDPERALELWRVLTEKRWTIADRFERGGRRYVVAYANEPSPRVDVGGLTLREKQVACLAAFGHANKEIAYELGISTSTVTAHLASALRRLGLRTRAQLAGRLFGHTR